MPRDHHSPYRHVRKRLWQRYRVRITEHEYARLCHALATGRHPCRLVLGWADETRVLIELRYARRPILAVWDQRARVIVTALPLTAYHRRQIAVGPLA
ncbi:hypothetical protein L1280_002803 [Deinococcus sp. HSC-46F16]|uniref:hypothetical protein n=1 Tax=Deinococcus sp. HSC-46F16 TaxID=2910968 RepID=UPI0020A0C624|nr:hypothetical protein [Deinococcus sp. HSC-46F16]MCP2015635.1 hypothetical protein [Deinococcus sp. HSC-46F16]